MILMVNFLSRKDGIPTFLVYVAETILTTGKYLMVMRECSYNVQVPASQNSKLMSFGSNHHYKNSYQVKSLIF